MKKRWIARLGVGIILVVALATTGFAGWATAGGDPEPEAVSALQSDAKVTVTNGDLIVFMPTTDPAPVGYVFYPGGRVEPEAYARIARPIAEAGYPVIIVRMPLDLAVLSPNRVNRAFNAYPTVKRWVMGGHSLGGAMAANFVYNHPDAVDGLVLLGAYPVDSLAGWGGEVVSLYGSRDGIATLDEIDESRALLPTEAQFIRVEGGNHAQFGDYGPQTDDLTATISPEAQQQQVIDATLALLEQVQSYEQPSSADTSSD